MTKPAAETGTAVPSGRSWWTRPDARGAALSLGLGVAVAGTLAVLFSRSTPWLGHDVVPIWVLALMFVVTEGVAVNLPIRPGGQALHLVEIPMVLALLGTDPVLLVLTRLIGGGAGLLILRRQRGAPLCFNLAVLGAQTTAAAVVFKAIAGTGEPADPRAWIAALAALVVADLVAAVVVLATDGPDRDPDAGPRLAAPLWSVPLVLATTGIGLIIALALVYDPWAIVPLCAVSLAGYLGSRSYREQSQGHAEVEALYSFTEAMSTPVDSEDLAAIAIGQFRIHLRADVAELVAPLDGGYVRLRMSGADEIEAMLLPEIPADAWWAPADAGMAVLVPAGSFGPDTPGEWPDPDGIAVPVAYSEGVAGIMMVSGRTGDLPTFGETEVRLFQALVGHAGAAMAKAHLVRELRTEVADREQLALRDQLTGLPNRKQFTLFLESVVEGEMPENGAAVILIDLDRFKEVNDALGHDSGDTMLREVGARLRLVLGRRGTVARLGGDEFGVLLPRIDSRAAAIAVGEELAASLEKPISVGDLNLNARASVGMAFAPDHGVDATALLRRADAAMYSAKEARGSVRVYEPADEKNTPRRLALIADLRGAIRRRDITVYFQPKVDLVTGGVVGAEALARWHHPEHGFVPPDEFIPLAEHTGLIRPLTLHVLEVALRRCAAWRRAGRDLHVAVNLSPNSLLDATLPDVVSRLLEQCDLPAEALTLEITESSIMSDPEGSMATLDLLNLLGVRLSIDDFGTGYSSLGRLRDLPIHEMKIDKSFVQLIMADHRDRAVVRSAIQLGHALDLAVVAEGVEDAATYAHLADEGCDLVQGYHVARPMPVDAFGDWLAARESTTDLAHPVRFPA